MKVFKQFRYVVLGFGLVVMAATAALNRPALAGRLDAWRLLPRVERFTELYFADPAHLPTAMRAGAVQNVAFTVHNREHQTTWYRYKIVAAPEGAGAERQIESGAFTLAHNQTKAMVRPVTISTPSPRLAIKVLLNYEGLTPEVAQPRLQQQSIAYWLQVKAATSKKLGSHATK